MNFITKKHFISKVSTAALIVALACSLNATAGDLTIPNSFTPNTPALAAEVNQNFNAVKTEVDDNDARLAALEALVASMQTTISNQQTAINNLQNVNTTQQNEINQLQINLLAAEGNISNLDSVLTVVENDLAVVENDLSKIETDLLFLDSELSVVKSNSVLDLDGMLYLSTINGYATAEFRGLNVQVNNGTGTTQGPVNGLGNLTVGYNETNTFAFEFCSDPQYDNSTDCTSNGEIWDRNVRRGSHNIIVGVANSYDDYGSFVAGWNNVVNSAYSSVSGGSFNTASGLYSSVSGGMNNTANNDYSSVSGGYENTASGLLSTVSGGSNNTASGDYSSVSGGMNNTASGWSANVSGGKNRTASGISDWVAGSLFEDN